MNSVMSYIAFSKKILLPNSSMTSQSNSSTCEVAFFVEHDEVVKLISILSSSSPSNDRQPENESKHGEIILDNAEALAKLRKILDKYLECSTLLDPFLETIVQKLCLPAQEIIHELFFALSNRHFLRRKNCSLKNDISFENKDEKDLADVYSYRVINELNTLMHLLSAIYAVSKVRGHKHIQRFLPHDAADVEPVLTLLRWFGWLEKSIRLKSTDEYGQLIPLEMHLLQQKLMLQQKEVCDVETAKVWESIYTLLIWMGIISLVPFDLSIIDSSINLHSNDNTQHLIDHCQLLPIEISASTTLVQSILATCISHLSASGPTREAAAACLASLLSRPDLERSQLDGFMAWSGLLLYWYRTGNTLKDVLAFMEENPCFHEPSSILAEKNLPIPNEKPTVFQIMGIIQTLAAVFKMGHRFNLLSTKQKVHGVELLWEQSILIAESHSGVNGAMSGGAMILRKLLVKLFARIGCAYLPPRVATWRYKLGRRSLLENLLRDSVSAESGSNETEASSATSKYNSMNEKALFQIPDQVEDAMDQLLRSLTDPATIVRWSAAKGIGRLTERLPEVCADDVLDALILTCSDSERDRAWHGVCLALAELARRGLLLPHRLRGVVPMVTQAIGYDLRRGQHSIGAHVRDAACYTCWAFARAYEPSVLGPYVKDLSVALVLTSLFDREVNCRRAASAAFQESVGRQGANNFKHGIEVLTAADYYTLGNINDSYLNISLTIARFDEYQKPIIHHLSGIKLHHWDNDIRTMASLSLARVSKLDPLYCANEVLPKLLFNCFSDDLIVRHGSLLGAAEMVLSFGELNLLNNINVLSEDIISSIVELIPSIEKKRLYRGRGGEMMKGAACRMIECISLANIPLTVKQQVRLLDSVDACLNHPHESIQNSATRALHSLLTNYFPVSNKGPSERLQNRVVDKFISIVNNDDNPAATRGYCLAVGSLPGKLLAPNDKVLESVLDCLCNASKKDCLVGYEGDAETRRNAIIALVNVCKTVGIQNNDLTNSEDGPPVHSLSKCQMIRIVNSLLAAMEDYNMDRRGDVGSWSRIAAMKGLEALTYLAINASSVYPHSAARTASISYEISEEAILAPPFQHRLALAEKVVTNELRNALSEKAKFSNVMINSRMIFDETWCFSFLSNLLKQLGEKLDAVRLQAGECLERLLTNDSPLVPFVPYRNMLISALDINGRDKNWSNPAVTFPLLMRAIDIECFLEPILSGMVISVGGLTESVSKNSTAALFEWIRELKISKRMSTLVQIGDVFLGLLRKNKRNWRVLFPLLATLEKVLSNGYLDELLCREDGILVCRLMTNLSAEAKKCHDVRGLLAIIAVTISLVQPYTVSLNLIRKEILPLIMTMLMNPYPRVRRYVADQLFAKLSVDGEGIITSNEDLEEANQILLNVVWHEEHDPLGKITVSRNRIADLLKVHLTDEERSVKITKCISQSCQKDDFESYSSLVNSTT